MFPGLDIHKASSLLGQAEAEKKAAAGEDDYKGDLKFASYLKTQTATSSFAKNRTLKEQWEYLPAFAC